MRTFETSIQFTTHCHACGLTIPYEESVVDPSGDLCRPCAAIHLIRHGGSITGALRLVDAIPTPGDLKARSVLEIEAERLASKEVASTQAEPAWLPTKEEIDALNETGPHSA